MDLPKIPEIEEYYVVHSPDDGYFEKFSHFSGRPFFGRELMRAHLFPDQVSAISVITEIKKYEDGDYAPQVLRTRKMIMCLDD